MNGVIILDKPQDFTSFDAVAVMRGLAKERKIGHTGTLDPMATGVLPLLLGRAAKAADLLPDTAKEYRAAFRFGERTDTGDVTGKTVETDSRAVSRNSLDLALDGFRGQISQIPPMYSAVSVHGKRLYELARKGIEVEREARKIYIEKLVLEAYSPENREGVLRVACSKGTYIRTLIEDIAKSVGTCGVMTGLRRVRACGFQETEAHTLWSFGNLPHRVLSARCFFPSTACSGNILRCGQALPRRSGSAMEVPSPWTACTCQKSRSGRECGSGFMAPKGSFWAWPRPRRKAAS